MVYLPTFLLHQFGPNVGKYTVGPMDPMGTWPPKKTRNSKKNNEIFPWLRKHSKERRQAFKGTRKKRRIRRFSHSLRDAFRRKLESKKKNQPRESTVDGSSNPDFRKFTIG